MCHDLDPEVGEGYVECALRGGRGPAWAYRTGIGGSKPENRKKNKNYIK